MEEIKDITVAFTGHRTYSHEADDELRLLVRRLYAEGYSRFLCGMAWGFDLAAGEIVAELKQEHPEVELIAVVPHKGFFQLFRGEDAEQYKRVADIADGAEFLSDVPTDRSYLRRNDFLVDNATVVVAWWDGVPRGGTAYTLRCARHARCRVINLYPDPQLDFGF